MQLPACAVSVHKCGADHAGCTHCAKHAACADVLLPRYFAYCRWICVPANCITCLFVRRCICDTLVALAGIVLFARLPAAAASFGPRPTPCNTLRLKCVLVHLLYHNWLPCCLLKHDVCLQLPRPLAQGPSAALPSGAALAGDAVPGSGAQPAANSDAAAGEGAGAAGCWASRSQLAVVGMCLVLERCMYM
jgi:hypothetical protein